MALQFSLQLLIGIPVIVGVTIFFARVISPAQHPGEEKASCDCDGYVLYPVDEARQRYHRELVNSVLSGDQAATHQLLHYMRTVTNHPECWFARGDMVLKADFKLAWQRAVELAGENK